MGIKTIGLIYLLLVTCAYIWAFGRDPDKARDSIKAGATSLLNLLPMLFAIFALVGLFQEFLPAEMIESVMGTGNPALSLLVGGLLGAVSIGPPLASYPIAGSLLSHGAWPPAVAAFIMSWISVGVVTLPFEARIFTWRFALVRNSLTLVAALISGLFLGGLL
ncbi:permease [Geopsychrobacter electrodiphilus]|uniref:permease n=1 Tax=Geopsychrobacter electrodiphilus TaxID=225196 RepID=UPI0003616318|nr:permease [Geopsychrobacter electrodiphilus]